MWKRLSLAGELRKYLIGLAIAQRKHKKFLQVKAAAEAKPLRQRARLKKRQPGSSPRKKIPLELTPIQKNARLPVPNSAAPQREKPTDTNAPPYLAQY